MKHMMLFFLYFCILLSIGNGEILSSCGTYGNSAEVINYYNFTFFILLVYLSNLLIHFSFTKNIGNL